MDDLTRRDTIKLIAAAGATAALSGGVSSQEATKVRAPKKSSTDNIAAVTPLDFVWQTRDPFLFCVHHDDAYPPGNERLGPDPRHLAGRNLGQDFDRRDGWRMYHGDVVPGFPQHPHRGFETVTVVRRGLLDHSDSLGATARYGDGDVQWLTTGSGIQHAEMFPLLRVDRGNPVELFQIWLNLPRANKMVEPYFSMFWAEDMPRRVHRDAAGRVTTVTLVAGHHQSATAVSPPPDSWASQADADVAIWTVKMEPHAAWTLPAASPETNRDLYFFVGEALEVNGGTVAAGHRIELRDHQAVELRAQGGAVELLLLQGRPIAEPVVQHGPFVMNTREEIRQAFSDYQHTRFGGWPWERPDPVHPRGQGRFAQHADGRIEEPG